MAAPLTEVEQLKRDAKLVGSLAKQLPGLSAEQGQKILEAVQLELQRWIEERQSAQDLLRQLLAQHDVMQHDVKLTFGLVRLATEKVLGMKDHNAELHSETLAAFEAIRQEMHELHAATFRLVDQVRGLVEELRARETPSR
jgi:hypothetical protein